MQRRQVRRAFVAHAIHGGIGNGRNGEVIGPQQRLTVNQALRQSTAGGAAPFTIEDPVTGEFEIENRNRTVGAMLSGAVAKRYGEAGLRGVVYQEVFGPDPAQAEESMAGLRRRIARIVFANCVAPRSGCVSMRRARNGSSRHSAAASSVFRLDPAEW